MSYADRRQNRTVAIGAVVAVHMALGYALLTGLATTVIEVVTHEPTLIYDVPVVQPPPPERKTLPKPDTHAARPADPLTAPPREVPLATGDPVGTTIIDLPPLPPIPDALPAKPAEPTAPTVSLARGAAARGNQGDWFPSDSYPSAARRASAEGLVSVRVGVGANGRVTDCAVTASSGNADLDGATCRLATRNGRFEPARDAAGEKVPSIVNLRNVRWRLTD